MLNAKEYVRYMNEAAENDGYRANYFGVPGVDDKTSTDWQDAVFRTAPVTNMNARRERRRRPGPVLSSSGSYFDQKGVAIGSGYGRGSGRLNLDFAPTDRLNLKTSVGLTRESHQRFENDDTIEGVVANAIALQPLFPVRNPDGSFTGRRPSGPLAYVNPVAIATYNNINTRTLRALGNVEASYHLSTALQLNGRFGADVLAWPRPALRVPGGDGIVCVHRRRRRASGLCVGDALRARGVRHLRHAVLRRPQALAHRGIQRGVERP